MMRRTVVLAIEIEGSLPDALALRDAARHIRGDYRWRVAHVEIIDDGMDRPAPPIAGRRTHR